MKVEWPRPRIVARSEHCRGRQRVRARAGDNSSESERRWYEVKYVRLSIKMSLKPRGVYNRNFQPPTQPKIRSAVGDRWARLKEGLADAKLTYVVFSEQYHGRDSEDFTGSSTNTASRPALQNYVHDSRKPQYRSNTWSESFGDE